MADLTPAEEKWIKALERLAKRRPKTLGLWGGTGDLVVIALDENGNVQHDGASVGDGHREVVVNAGPSIRIPSGGGDPDWVYLEDIDRPWVDGQRGLTMVDEINDEDHVREAGEDPPACIGQWCCGCERHPSGKPWGSAIARWAEHDKTCPKAPAAGATSVAGDEQLKGGSDARP